MPLMGERHSARRARWWVRGLAAFALIVSAQATRLPVVWLDRGCGVLRHLPPAPSALAREVSGAVLAARPHWWGGRLACMEVSLATVIALALCGFRVHWVLGARALPNEAHAWVVGDGYTLGLEEDDPVRPWTAALITPPARNRARP
ncbi:lasso peptide biosynthesis B2 protein [Streptomyces sp. CFMR 7]|uniref:lasso peptide biosynthesis B2 protein n=1 Tax=Streptomyces sp. CFMR 7 TaxID=1649184 RepID=UPI0011A874BF|nr:lasso peptide biosynthesis B2 protein [Streptomyces sp. CFMR 7]